MDTTPATISQDSIRALLLQSDTAVEEALLRLYARQTQDEKQTRDAKHRNHRGFNGRDAKAGSKYAVWIIGMRRDHKAKPGTCLQRPDHKVKAREIALRYTRQLLEEALEKRARQQKAAAHDVATTTSCAAADEAVMNAIVQAAELEEAHRVAQFKAWRDERLQEPTFVPGARVATKLIWGYSTIAELALSGTYEGDIVRVAIGKVPQASGAEWGNVVHTGLVMAAGRMDDGTPVNRVLFGGKSVWVRSFSLQRVTT